MKLLWVVVSVIVLVGCSSQPTEEQLIAREKEYEEWDRQERALTAGFDQVVYPDCETVWKSEKATTCGRETFKVAYGECTARAVDHTGGTGAVLDWTAGPTWVTAAGGTTLRTFSERVELMEKIGKPALWQTVTLALGNGTRAIKDYTCWFDGLKLTSVSDGPAKQVPIPRDWQ